MTPEQLAQMLQASRGWVTSKTRRSCVNPLPHMRIGCVGRSSAYRSLTQIER